MYSKSLDQAFIFLKVFATSNVNVAGPAMTIKHSNLAGNIRDESICPPGYTCLYFGQGALWMLALGFHKVCG